MRNVVTSLILLSYFILVAASLRHSSALYISGYLILAIAHLVKALIDFFDKTKRPQWQHIISKATFSVAFCFSGSRWFSFQSSVRIAGARGRTRTCDLLFRRTGALSSLSYASLVQPASVIRSRSHWRGLCLFARASFFTNSAIYSLSRSGIV